MAGICGDFGGPWWHCLDSTCCYGFGVGWCVCDGAWPAELGGPSLTHRETAATTQQARGHGGCCYAGSWVLDITYNTGIPRFRQDTPSCTHPGGAAAQTPLWRGFKAMDGASHTADNIYFINRWHGGSGGITQRPWQGDDGGPNLVLEDVGAERTAGGSPLAAPMTAPSRPSERLSH